MRKPVPGLTAGAILIILGAAFALTSPGFNGRDLVGVMVIIVGWLVAVRAVSRGDDGPTDEQEQG